MRKKSVADEAKKILFLKDLRMKTICVKKMRPAFLANWPRDLSSGRTRRVRLPPDTKRKVKTKTLPIQEASLLERMKGVEPSSSAWKAEIISRYMTSAKIYSIYKSEEKMSIPIITIFFFDLCRFPGRIMICLYTFRYRQYVQVYLLKNLGYL